MSTTSKPWPPERWPTPAEWVDWLLTLPREDQEAVAGRVIEAQQAAAKCFGCHAWRNEAVIASNRRVLEHEATTPMRGHDADGVCCRAAATGGDA